MKDDKFTYVREIACSIVDEFEELLDEKNITIPSDDREGQEDKARLYGSEYYQIEDVVVERLRKVEKDLINLCGDNEVMKDVIEIYFEKEV